MPPLLISGARLLGYDNLRCFFHCLNGGAIHPPCCGQLRTGRSVLHFPDSFARIGGPSARFRDPFVRMSSPFARFRGTFIPMNGPFARFRGPFVQ
jgi:hypothetical protein